MKLILSSCDFRNEQSRQVILAHLPRPLSECRLLFIPNEKWTPQKLDDGVYLRRMREHGFSEPLISVFDPRRPDDFSRLPLDTIYVSGGNSFELLAMLRRCAFDQAVIRYIRSGTVYIGGSAGAHLVTKDLSHLTCYDKPPSGMTDFSGLNLWKGILLCHYSSERRAHYEHLCAESRMPVAALTDDDSLIVTE